MHVRRRLFCTPAAGRGTLLGADVAGLGSGKQPQVLPDEAQAHQLFHHALHVKAAGVVAVVVLDAREVLAALTEVLVVVQVPRVARYTEIIPHVHRPGHLLARHQGLVELLAVARADDPHLRLSVLGVNFCIYILKCSRQGVEGGRRGLLDEQVAVVPVGERVHHEVHSVVKGHHEPGHVRIRYGYGLALRHLLHPQGDHRAPAGHHVAVARAADRRRRALAQLAPLGYGDLLHQGLGDAHRVDRIGRLVRGQDHHVTHAVLYRAVQHVARAQHVGPRGLHREELARGHLLQRGCGEHVVRPAHRHVNRAPVTHVADVELHLPGPLRVLRLEVVAHVVLLLLVAREDADLPDVRGQEPPQHGVPETARAACYQQDFLREY